MFDFVRQRRQGGLGLTADGAKGHGGQDAQDRVVVALSQFKARYGRLCRRPDAHQAFRRRIAVLGGAGLQYLDERRHCGWAGAKRLERLQRTTA